MSFVAAYTWRCQPGHEDELIRRSQDLRVHETRLGAVIAAYRVVSGGDAGSIVFTATFDSEEHHAAWIEALEGDPESVKILDEMGNHDAWSMTAVATSISLDW